jgi:type IV pilus assembly protein PilV
MRIGGFSLVEVLVALSVLAAGVAGAVAAQGTALRTRRETRLASQAVVLAGSLADAMRANAALFLAPDGGNPYLQLDFDAARSTPPAQAACAQLACSAVEQARTDVAVATYALAAQFPGGRVAVCRDAQVAEGALAWDCVGGPGATVVIKIGWAVRREDATAAERARPRLVMAVPELG